MPTPPWCSKKSYCSRAGLFIHTMSSSSRSSNSSLVPHSSPTRTQRTTIEQPRATPPATPWDAHIKIRLIKWQCQHLHDVPRRATAPELVSSSTPWVARPVALAHLSSLTHGQRLSNHRATPRLHHEMRTYRSDRLSNNADTFITTCCKKIYRPRSLHPHHEMRK